MEKHYRAANLEELKAVALNILHDFSDYSMFKLEGTMGAGKTTLTRALCEAMHCEDEVSSPTFSIANEYSSPTHGTVYHFDLYRLESPDELHTIGIDYYFDMGDFFIVEWPLKAGDLLPEGCVIYIEVEDENTRNFKVVTE